MNINHFRKIMEIIEKGHKIREDIMIQFDLKNGRTLEGSWSPVGGDYGPVIRVYEPEPCTVWFLEVEDIVAIGRDT